jgi:hypothetical protein
VTSIFEGERRYGFWRNIPRQEGEGPGSFPPRTNAETLEIARYEAEKQGTLPEEYTTALAFYSPIDGALVAESAFTSAQMRAE